MPLYIHHSKGKPSSGAFQAPENLPDEMTPERHIQHIDSQLALLRESYMEARGTKRDKWMDLINKALDERLIHMKERDAR